VVVQLALLFGASRVFAAEPNAFRRELAANLGANALDPNEQSMDEVLQHMDGGHGVEVAFETSGARQALPWLLDAVDRESRIVTVGHPGQPVPLDVAAYINKKGVVLAGVFGRRIWDTWEILSQLVVSGRLDLSWLITHRLDLAEFENGMQLLRRGESGKIIVYPK
jgi:threonine 3-dehydrogenase